MRVIRDETPVGCEELSDQEVRMVLDNLLAWLGLRIRFSIKDGVRKTVLLKGTQIYEILK